MKTVLIIEDDPIILHIYKDQIKKAGFAVEIAVNGEDGLRAVQQIDPDFILLDLMLPKVDGVEFLKRIRGQKEFEQTPIFVFTNVYLSDLAKDAAKAGATQVFDKSVVVPQDIIRAIRDFLGSSADSSASHRTSSAQATNSEAKSLPADARAPDTNSQHELVQAFVETAPETLLGLRKILQALAKNEGSAARLTQLSNLYEKIHSLGGGAAAAGLRSLSQLSAALEALLKQLTDKPDDLTPSSLRTLSHAMDFLDVLFKHDAPADPLEASPLKILVVDDESLSRLAIVSALKRAKLSSVDVDNPKVALQLLTERSFDLIFLDVSMPDMNGFDLCRELRKLPIHKTTPIIFITSSADFESRSLGALSGGNDLIAKPFLFTELTVKALNYALKNRFSQPDLSVREIAVADQINRIKPTAEVIVFGDHGEILSQESAKQAPREKNPAPRQKQQPPRAAVPKSVFAVIKNSFPSMVLRSNPNPAKSVPAAVMEEQAEPIQDAEAVDQAEAEGSRVEKQSAAHTQVEAKGPKGSSEGQQVEARYAELAKSRDALTEELNRQKQIEDALRQANHDLNLRVHAQTNPSPEAVTALEPENAMLGEQAISSGNITEEEMCPAVCDGGQSKDADNRQPTHDSSRQMSADRTSESPSIAEPEAKVRNPEVVLKADPNIQGCSGSGANSEPESQPNQKLTELPKIPKKAAPPKDEVKETYEDRDNALESERRSEEVKVKNSEAVGKTEPDIQEDVEAPLCQIKSELAIQPSQKRTELTQIPKKVAPQKDEAKEAFEERDYASESDQRKRDVLDDLSHKLRQPAHQLLGIAEKLLGTPLTTEQRALVASMQSRAESLLCLNQALIERPRAAVAHPNPRWLTFDLYSALEEATEEFADEARHRKIELAVLVDQRVPLELQGDQSCLCKVLTHLIRPTLKLAKTGPVLLHVTKEEEIQASVTLRFVVRGFDLERGQKFQRCWLQAIASGEQPKVGKYEDGELDIAIAQQLVGVMKGRFDIEFSADLSSSFWFNVEFSKATESLQSPLVGFRALVIDQDQMKRDLLQARLQASGLECSTVANATDAPALLRREIASGDPFKVALIGGQLGDMSGLTLTKFLKGDPALTHIALVIMAGEKAEFQDELYRDAGIFACITEPLRQARLFAILREIACQC